MFDQKIISEIKAGLTNHGETIAIAESVTSGLLQLALSTAVDASHFFQGGITAYNIGQKARHLQIDPILALKCNCVSQQMAEQMARNVCGLFASNWGVGITGYASPVPESRNKTFAFFAIIKQGEVLASDEVEYSGEDPFLAQQHYARIVLGKLADVLGNDYAK